MEATVENTILGLAPEVAQGLSLLLFVLTAFLFMMVIFISMKNRQKGRKALPSAGVALLMIGIVSFVGALLLKLS